MNYWLLFLLIYATVLVQVMSAIHEFENFLAPLFTNRASTLKKADIVFSWNTFWIEKNEG